MSRDGAGPGVMSAVGDVPPAEMPSRLILEDMAHFSVPLNKLIHSEVPESERHVFPKSIYNLNGNQTESAA